MAIEAQPERTQAQIRTKQLQGVVSHTHWDREWYQPFERFRMKLVETVDMLLDVLEDNAGYQYFMLDGQTIVLEEYLAIRPENADRLRPLAKQGRIMVGPWYVLPDEFLVSPESLIRNLLLGRLMAEPYGGAMRVGYVPDTFGHPAQLPQILRRFGLDSAVLFRGVQMPKSEFIWKAPDGSRVLTVFMPGGYCDSMVMSAVPKRFLELRAPQIIENLKEAATTDTILLMNGCDHLPPRRELSQIIAEANRRLPDVELRQGTLEEYLAMVRQAQPELSEIQGEFRQNRPGRVTPGVLSSRLYLKQENHRSSVLLERYAEPLAAMAADRGYDHPKAFLWQSWKYLLQNHPHDSICGCSIDAVHQDMMGRYRWSQQIGQEIANNALQILAGSVDTSELAGDIGLLVYNPVARPRVDYVLHSVQLLEKGARFHIRDSKGKVVPHQIIARRHARLKYDPFTRSIDLDARVKPATVVLSRDEMREIVEKGVWREWAGEEVDIVFLAEVPALGYETYSLSVGAARPRVKSALRADLDWAENDFVKVTVLGNGTLQLWDKRSDTIYIGLNCFEDRGDSGDEYTYCPPTVDAVHESRSCRARVSLIEMGPVRATFEVRAKLAVPLRLSTDRRRRTDEKVCLSIISYVSLYAHSPRVEIRAEIDSQAEDHVLKALFPAPVETQWSYAQGQFEVRRRPIALDAAELARELQPDEEYPTPTQPQRAFVDVNDGQRGLAVLNRGLTEFEVRPGQNESTIALTLLRAVGWLSRPDLSTRWGNAGPSLPTPDAQCKGTQVCEYAILPHQYDWEVVLIGGGVDGGRGH